MKTEITSCKLESILNDVRDELYRACNKFHAYNSAHEGYAVILEELDELFDEIKGDHRTKMMYDEAKQIAATAIRFMYDICTVSNNPKGEIQQT